MSNHTPKPIQIPLPLDDATIEISLTRGYVAIIDAIDADLLAFKWYPKPGGADIPAVWRHFKFKGKQISVGLHRTIMERILNCSLSDDIEVDHIDRNPLNNRRNNLRLATHHQNQFNKGIRIESQSPYKGVRQQSGVWQARITYLYEMKHIGNYSSAEDAAIAYNHAAAELFGEYAYFNDIPNWQSRIPEKRNYQSKKKSNTSGHVGINFHRREKKWIARVTINGKRIRIGSYATIENAIEARNSFLKKVT